MARRRIEIGAPAVEPERATTDGVGSTHKCNAALGADWEADRLREEAYRLARSDHTADVMRLSIHPELLHQMLNGGVDALNFDESRAGVGHVLRNPSNYISLGILAGGVQWSAMTTDWENRIWTETADEAPSIGLFPTCFEPSALDRALAIAVMPNDCDGSEGSIQRLGRRSHICYNLSCWLVLGCFLLVIIAVVAVRN